MAIAEQVILLKQTFAHMDFTLEYEHNGFLYKTMTSDAAHLH